MSATSFRFSFNYFNVGMKYVWKLAHEKQMNEVKVLVVTRFYLLEIQFQLLAVAHWNATDDLSSIFPSAVYNSIVWQKNLTKTRHQNIDIRLNVERVSIVSPVYSLTHSLFQCIILKKKGNTEKKNPIFNLLFFCFFRFPLFFIKFSPLIGQRIDIALMVLLCTASSHWHFDMILLSMPFHMFAF